MATRVLPGARARRHAVWRLEADLLLVFKPAGHREASHAHPHAQRLIVVAGRLQVRVGGRTTVLRASSRPLRIAPGQAHATDALEDTWLVARAEPDEVASGRAARAPAARKRVRARSV